MLPKYPCLGISLYDGGTSHPALTKTGFMILKDHTTKYCINGHVHCKIFMASALPCPSLSSLQM